MKTISFNIWPVAAFGALFLSVSEPAFAGAILRQGTVDEVKKRAYDFEIARSDLERLCTEKSGSIYHSKIHPESSPAYADLLRRGRALIEKLGIKNHDGSRVSLFAMDVHRQIVDKRFSVWVAAFCYKQTISEANGKAETRDILISIPLARIPLIVKSIP